MKPIKLTMQAFGPYVDKTVIDFGDLGDRDFFLIHGATGAGKTSILDAICYALYGDTSVEGRSGDMLRNQMAELDNPTYVELIFQLGKKQYKVRRNPNYDRKKSRGEGLTREKAAAELFYLDEEGVEKPLATKAQEVTAQISSLIGFRSDQFRQVVLIPQGEFRRLLMAGSDEREKIMEILFKTGIFRDIENTLKKQADEINKQNEALKAKSDAVLMDTGADSLEALVELEKAKTAEVNETSKKTSKLKAVYDEVQRKKSDLSAIEELFQQQEQAKNKLNQYEEKKPAAELAKKQLDTAKRINSLSDVKRQALSANKLFLEKKNALELAKADFEKAGREQERATILREKSLKLQPDRDNAKSQIERLRGFESLEKELRAAETNYEKTKKSAEKLEIQLSEKRLEHEALQQSFQKLSEEEKQLLDVPAEYARKKAECDRLLRPKNRLSEVEKNISDIRGAAFSYVSQEKTVDRWKMQVQKAEKDRDRLHYLQISGYAAHLAGELKDGEACPVCGSTEHPKLAISEEIIPTKEEIAEAEAEIEKCRGWMETAAKQWEAAKGKWISSLSAMSNALRELSKELREAGYTGKISAIDDLDPADAMTAVTSLKEGLTEGKEWLSGQIEITLEEAEELSKKEERLSAVKVEKEKISQRAEELSNAIEMLTSSVDTVKNELGIAQGKLEEKKKNIPEKYREHDVLKKEIFQAEKESERLEAEHRKAEEAYAEASRTYSSALAAYKAQQDALKEALELSESSKALFEERMLKAGFLDIESLESTEMSLPKAFKTEEGLKAVEKRIQDYHSGMEALSIRLSELQQNLEGRERPDMETAQKEAESAEAAWRMEAESLASLKAQQELLRSKIKKLQELENSFAELFERHRNLGFLAEIASGKNNSRMTFQTYVLRALLRDVVDAANLRLIKMSRGQYQLQPANEVRDLRKQSGLDLVIYDDFTGTQRPMATLSGGESFLASLSLALGLADVVKSYSGGIRLDTIFIDEGFGTLDGETLDMAIKTLSDLRQNGRLVGIISHVEELKHQIPVRLEITKGRHGSHARFSIDD